MKNYLMILFFLPIWHISPSDAVLCVDLGEGDQNYHNFHSPSGLDAVLKISVFEGETEQAWGTGTLIHPSYVLTSKHVVREGFDQVLGFMATPQYATRSSIFIMADGKAHPVSEVIEDLDDHGRENYPGLRNLILDKMAFVQNLLSGDGEAKDQIGELARQLSLMDTASDIVLLKLETPLEDITPMPLGVLDFGGKSTLEKHVILCGYGRGFIYRGPSIEPSESDLLSIFSDTFLLHAGTDTCTIEKVPLPDNPNGSLYEEGALCVKCVSKNFSIAEGDSGGPLINEDGALVGVAAKSTLDIFDLRDFLKNLMAKSSEKEKWPAFYQEEVVPAMTEAIRTLEKGTLFSNHYAGFTERLVDRIQAFLKQNDEEPVDSEEKK